VNSSGSFQSSKEAIKDRMRRLGICEADIEETFARSSGPGGQNVNKVSTAVTLRYAPANITVVAQDSRSQAQNRQIARERLVKAMEEKVKSEHAARRAAAAKRRRQNARRSRAAKEQILQTKHRRSQLKKLRSRVAD
jgi:peptide chain release factor